MRKMERLDAPVQHTTAYAAADQAASINVLSKACRCQPTCYAHPPACQECEHPRPCQAAAPRWLALQQWNIRGNSHVQTNSCMLPAGLLPNTAGALLRVPLPLCCSCSRWHRLADWRLTCTDLVWPDGQRAPHSISQLDAAQAHIVRAAPAVEQHQLQAAALAQIKSTSKSATLEADLTAQHVPVIQTAAALAASSAHLKPHGSTVAKFSPGCCTSRPVGPAALARSSALCRYSSAAAGLGRLHAQATLSLCITSCSCCCTPAGVPAAGRAPGCSGLRWLPTLPLAPPSQQVPRGMSCPKSKAAVPGARRTSTPPGGDTSTPSAGAAELTALIDPYSSQSTRNLQPLRQL